MLLPIILFVLFNPPPEPEVTDPPPELKAAVNIPVEPTTTGAPVTIPTVPPTVIPVVVKGEDALPSPTPKEPIVPVREATEPTATVLSSKVLLKTQVARDTVANHTKTQEELVAEHVKAAPISSGSLVNPPATSFVHPLVTEIQTNCLAHRAAEAGSGIYNVNPDEGEPFFVYCDMETEGGGWTVLQRRIDGSEEFHNKYYDAYDLGFGKLDGNLWLGLNYMHRLAPMSSTPQILRIELHGDQCNATSCSGQPDGMWWGEWEFKLADKEKGYALYVSNSPLAGNMTNPEALQSNYHWETASGMKFTTLDNDNDESNVVNCAQFRNLGAWWHRECSKLALNGKYADNSGTTRHLSFYRDGPNNSAYFIKPKKTVMMIRPPQ